MRVKIRNKTVVQSQFYYLLCKVRLNNVQRHSLRTSRRRIEVGVLKSASRTTPWRSEKTLCTTALSNFLQSQGQGVQSPGSDKDEAFLVYLDALVAILESTVSRI